jgi:hypothetical protein
MSFTIDLDQEGLGLGVDNEKVASKRAARVDFR